MFSSCKKLIKDFRCEHIENIQFNDMGLKYIFSLKNKYKVHVAYNIAGIRNDFLMVYILLLYNARCGYSMHLKKKQMVNPRRLSFHIIHLCVKIYSMTSYRHSIAATY